MPRRSPFRRLAAATLATVVVAHWHPDAQDRLVPLRLSDGRMISGLWIEAQSLPAAAVVLVPMLGRPRDEWQAAGQRLADANINALAVDLPASALPRTEEELAGWKEVVTAAVAYLVARPADVREGAIGVAGSSLGGSLAALAAAGDVRIRSLALISPSLDYRGVRIEPALAAYGPRPALLMASVHDPYAARSVRTLVKDAPGLREVRWSNAVAHGTRLLSRDPELTDALVEWFQQTLGVQ